MKKRRIKRYVRSFEKLSTKEKKKHPLISKKDIKKKKDKNQYAKKLETAEELGLLNDVKKKGWSGLTAAETGRIGGIMSRQMRKKKRFVPALEEEEQLENE